MALAEHLLARVGEVTGVFFVMPLHPLEDVLPNSTARLPSSKYFSMDKLLAFQQGPCMRYFIEKYKSSVYFDMNMQQNVAFIAVYLTRDYYDGFINDRVKYGSGKIWRNRSKPTTFSRSLFYRCPTFQLQNSKILFRM